MKKITLKDIIDFCKKENIRLPLEQAKAFENFFNDRFIKKTKTIQQHKAVFLYCKWNAEDLNNQGITMNEFFKKGIELPFTTESFREYVWKRTQKILFGTESINDLKKFGNIDMIFDVITKARAEKKLDYIPFPDKELLEREIENEYYNN